MAPAALNAGLRFAMQAVTAALVWLRSIQLRRPVAAAQRQRVEFAKHSIAVSSSVMYPARKKQTWPCPLWHAAHAAASIFAWRLVPRALPLWTALVLAPSTFVRVASAGVWVPAALANPVALLASSAALLLARVAPMHPRVHVASLLISGAIGSAQQRHGWRAVLCRHDRQCT